MTRSRTALLAAALCSLSMLVSESSPALAEGGGAVATSPSPPSAETAPDRWRLPRPSTGFLLSTAALMALDGAVVEALGKGQPQPERVKRLRKTGFRDSWFTAGVVGLVWAADGFSGRDGARTALNALVQAAVISESLKRLTGRERPFDAGDDTVFRGPLRGHHSFPSGHAAAAFAIAGAVGHCYPDMKVWLYLGAAMVGLSRIASGFHYPSDVFVGAGIGLSSARRASRGGGWVRIRF